MYHGIILEGISGTGKTTVFESLLTHDKINSMPSKSKLALSEHHTQRVLELEEQLGRLLPQHHIELLDELVTFVEIRSKRTSHRGWDSSLVQEHDLFYIFERFHLTHVYRFPYMRWHHVANIDERLKNLGAKMCLLTVNAEALEERLYSRRNECWLNYLKQYGKSPAEIISTLMGRQQLALELTIKSSLPSLVIDTSDTSIFQITETIASEFLLSG